MCVRGIVCMRAAVRSKTVDLRGREIYEFGFSHPPPGPLLLLLTDLVSPSNQITTKKPILSHNTIIFLQGLSRKRKELLPDPTTKELERTRTRKRKDNKDLLFSRPVAPKYRDNWI